MRPVLIPGVQCLLDEQASNAGAVDEQLAFDTATVLEHHGGNETVGFALLHADDLAFGAHEAVALSQGAQESGVQSGVEMVSVGNLAQR